MKLNPTLCSTVIRWAVSNVWQWYIVLVLCFVSFKYAYLSSFQDVILRMMVLGHLPIKLRMLITFAYILQISHILVCQLPTRLMRTLELECLQPSSSGGISYCRVFFTVGAEKSMIFWKLCKHGLLTTPLPHHSWETVITIFVAEVAL